MNSRTFRLFFFLFVVLLGHKTLWASFSPLEKEQIAQKLRHLFLYAPRTLSVSSTEEAMIEKEVRKEEFNQSLVMSGHNNGLKLSYLYFFDSFSLRPFVGYDNRLYSLGIEGAVFGKKWAGLDPFLSLTLSDDRFRLKGGMGVGLHRKQGRTLLLLTVGHDWPFLEHKHRKAPHSLSPWRVEAGFGVLW